MVDLVHLKHDGLDHIVTDDLEIGLADQMLNVLLAAGKEAVQADHLGNVAQVQLHRPPPCTCPHERAGSLCGSGSAPRPALT